MSLESPFKRSCETGLAPPRNILSVVVESEVLSNCVVMDLSVCIFEKLCAMRMRSHLRAFTLDTGLQRVAKYYCREQFENKNVRWEEISRGFVMVHVHGDLGFRRLVLEVCNLLLSTAGRYLFRSQYRYAGVSCHGDQDDVYAAVGFGRWRYSS